MLESVWAGLDASRWTTRELRPQHRADPRHEDRRGLPQRAAPAAAAGDPLPYVLPEDRTPRTGLLFRSPKTGQRLKDVRKLLDAVATRCRYPERAVNLYASRHSYCAARLQTLNRGAPVSPYTVGKELGDGGDALVRRVHGHLRETRHRAEVFGVPRRTKIGRAHV